MHIACVYWYICRKLADLIIYPKWDRGTLIFRLCSVWKYIHMGPISDWAQRSTGRSVSSLTGIISSCFPSVIVHYTGHRNILLQGMWISRGFLLVTGMNTSVPSVHVMSRVKCSSGPMQPLFYCMWDKYFVLLATRKASITTHEWPYLCCGYLAHSPFQVLFISQKTL